MTIGRSNKLYLFTYLFMGVILSQNEQLLVDVIYL